jgi:hypothetical protein
MRINMGDILKRVFFFFKLKVRFKNFFILRSLLSRASLTRLSSDLLAEGMGGIYSHFKMQIPYIWAYARK